MTKSKAVAKADAKKPVGLQKAEIIDGALILTGDGAARVMIEQAFGSLSNEFISYAIGQLINLLQDETKKDCTSALKAGLAQIKGIGPKGEMEAMLAIQMVCAHHAAVEMARRTVRTNNMDHKQVYGNLANKFSRTYVAQMEGLAKLRRGGKQVVEHVHINAGGQAVIANTVTTGGGG